MCIIYVRDFFLFRMVKDWFIDTVSIYAQILRLEPVFYEISIILFRNTNQNASDICVKPVMIWIFIMPNIYYLDDPGIQRAGWI